LSAEDRQAEGCKREEYQYSYHGSGPIGEAGGGTMGDGAGDDRHIVRAGAGREHEEGCCKGNEGGEFHGGSGFCFIRMLRIADSRLLKSEDGFAFANNSLKALQIHP